MSANAQSTWCPIGNGSMQIVGVDFSGNGTSDILWRNLSKCEAGIWQ